MEFFDTVLSEILDMFLSLHAVYSQCSKRPTLWFSDNISQFIASKNKAKQRAEKSGDPDDGCCFQHLKNELKAQIRQAKVDY